MDIMGKSGKAGKKKKGSSAVARDKKDRGMEEIEKLYRRMLVNEQGTDEGRWDIHPEIKSRLHKKILTDIEALRDAQKNTKFRSPEYREIDCRIRRRVLKEIQIIMDAYFVAVQENRLKEWKSMYGDIEHYKREFFYFRMDRDYESLEKTLFDYKFIDE